MHRNKHGLAVILLMGICAAYSSGIAVESEILWFVSYGGPLSEEPFALVPTDDGGWLLGAETSSFGAGQDDIWLIRLSDNGDSLWSNILGDSYQQTGQTVITITDEGWCLVANQVVSFPSIYNAWITSLDSTGNTLWSRLSSNPTSDQAVTAISLGDGVLVAGNFEISGQSYDQWLIRLNGSGDTLWARIWGGAGNDQALALLPTADGGSLLVGTTTSFSQMGQQITLWRNNAQGDSLWLRVFGDDEPQTVYDVVPVPSGGWLLACLAYNHFGFSVDDIWLLRVDEDGNELWSQYYGSQFNEIITKIMPTSDGGWLLAGTAHPNGPQDADLYLLRVDSNGDSLWSRTYGTTGPEWLHAAVLTSDSGCILGGSIYEAGSDYFDWWILKVDLEGDSLWSVTFGDSLWDDFIDIVTLTPEGNYLIVGETGVNSAGYSDIGLLCLEGPSSGFSPIPHTQPNRFAMWRPHPNPCNASTVLSFELPVSSLVKLGVYDTLGRPVAELINGWREAGRHNVAFDGTNLASGIYVYRLEAGQYTASGKMVLLR